MLESTSQEKTKPDVVSSNDKHRGVTRRQFLKTTGGVVGGLAATGLVGCQERSGSDASTDARQYETYATTCMSNCHGFACPLDVDVIDGKPFNITKFDMRDMNVQNVCQRGYSNIHRMYSPTRIKYPLRRVGERGAGQWERMSWEEAIELITSNWKSYQEEFGKGSILFSKGTGASSNITTGYTDRLAAYMGASNMPLPYDQAGYFCGVRNIGLNMPTNYWGTETRDLLNAKKVLVWGANPTEAATTSWHHVSKAAENGAKVIVIDPFYTIAASKADHYIPIRAASDGLLCIGMMQVLLRDDLVDEEFLKSDTVAPFLVKEDDYLYLRKSDLGLAEAGSEEDVILVSDDLGNVGSAQEIADPVIETAFEINGMKVTTTYSLLLERIAEWSMEDIAEKTDVPAETIEWLAHEYADGPSMIFSALGIDHWVNGHTGYNGMYAVMMMAGQLGKPGTGATVGDSSVPQAQGIVQFGMTNPADAEPRPTVFCSELHELLYNRPVDSDKPEVKSMYFYIHNPIGNMPDRHVWLEIFDALEMVVVADYRMSESCEYADVVLPVSFLWENMSVTGAGHPNIRLMEQVAEPQFDSKGDFEIATLLGQGMGLGDKFTMTREDFLKESLNNDGARAMGITWERLLEEKRVIAYPEEIPVCGINGTYMTDTGRAAFFQENPQPAIQTDREWDVKKESLLYWEPPYEAWYENEKIKQYPLNFMSERSKFKAHTQFNDAAILREIDPEPYLKMHPDDAAARGLESGDVARVFNDRGELFIKIVLNPGNRPGSTLIDHGWEEKDYIGGHYSNLGTMYSSNVVSNTCFFDVLVEVEKA